MSTIQTIKAESFLNNPMVLFGMSTRLGGVSPPPLGMNLSFNVGDSEENVRENRNIFFGSLGIDLAELSIPGQVHGNIVKVVERSGRYVECDALVTRARRVFLCVSVADCVPVFLLDVKKQVIAGIHAGWRGTVANIAGKAMEVMKREFSVNPSDILAFVGPAASACCYTVGEEVTSRFDQNFIAHRDASMFLDLKSANVAQLQDAGVPRHAIEVSPMCTICEPSLLHSYRREKEKSGRMIAVIGLV